MGKKPLFLLFLALSIICACFASSLRAETYFIAKHGGDLHFSQNGWPSEPDPRVSDLEELVTNICNDGDTIVLDGGPVGEKGIIYIGENLDDDGSLDVIRPVTIRGCDDADPGYFAHGGDVILSGQGISNYIIRILPGANGSVISHLHFNGGRNGPAIYISDQATIKDVVISDCKNGIFSCCNSNVYRAVIKDCLGYTIRLQGSEQVNYSIFSGGGGVLVGDGSSPTLNNCLIQGQAPYAVVLEDNSHVTLNNSILTGNGSYWYNEYVIRNQFTSTATLNNCIILPSPFETDKYYYNGMNVEVTNCLHEPPMFKRARRPAIVIFGSDDAGNLGYYVNVIKPALDKYGWKGVVAYNRPSQASEGDWSTMRSLVAEGHQIANHGDFYSRNVQDHSGFTIYYEHASAQDASIAISDTSGDGYADKMTFRVDGELDRRVNGTGVIDLEETKFNRIGKICDYLNGLEQVGYSCSLRGEYTAASRYLADVGNTLIPLEGLYLDLDSSRVWNGELYDTKRAFEENLGPGYSLTGWVGPGNGTSEEMRRELLKLGYTGARGGYPDRGSIMLESFNVYNFFTHALFVIFRTNDPSYQDIKARIGSQLEWLKYHGGILYYYAHNLNEFTARSWGALLELVKESGVDVMTLEQASEFVRTYNPTGDLTTNDNMTFTRTMKDEGDYRFLWSSPCLNAGIVVLGLHDKPELAFDVSGTPILNEPDIGPYEHPYALGDYDWDQDIDGLDLAAFRDRYINEDIFADLNNDQVIDSTDLQSFASHFGQ